MERQEILNKFIQIIEDFYYIDLNINEKTKIVDLGIDDEYNSVIVEVELERNLKLPSESCDCFISDSETIKEVIDKISDLVNK